MVHVGWLAVRTVHAWKDQRYKQGRYKLVLQASLDLCVTLVPVRISSSQARMCWLLHAGRRLGRYNAKIF